VVVDREISLKIPPGVDTGSQLRLRGEGEPGEQGGPPGDLFVVLHVKEHDFFKREGEHLFCEIPVSFAQAALGHTLKMPSLGREDPLVLKIPKGTQPGEILSINGEGMPIIQRNKRGNLFVKINVQIPKKLSQRQKELLEEFAKEDAKKGSKGLKQIWEKITS
jgi:molecular chaperone DnaJ